MTEITEAPVTPEEMAIWYNMVQQLGKLKSQEMLLRKRIFRHHFPDPKEGTNTFILPDKYQLKGVHKIDRQIDVPALTTLRPMFEEKGLKVDNLLKVELSLKVKEYKAMTEEEKKLFDQALIVKSGAPDLKIEPPKGGKKTAEETDASDDPN